MDTNTKVNQSKDRMLNDNYRNDSMSSEDDSEHLQNGRHTWSKKTEYVLSTLGYCVGLGNIWRFPYICMRNGGGAFLIPFFVSLLICAQPVYFLEAAIGQFVGKSSFHVWCICPLFKGIGVSMNILSVMISWYYAMILAWCLVYLVNTFHSTLPWMRCDGSWNTPNCIPADQFYNIKHTTTTVSGMGLEGNATGINTTLSALGNETADAFGNWTSGGNGTDMIDRVSSTKEFWLHNVLEITGGWDEFGGLTWHLSLALVMANCVVLLAIVKGVHSSGKVVYVTATLPYILLTVMLILGCTLPGAGDGVYFYIMPDFSKLLVIQTWVEASIQVFYSLGPGWGSLIAMASYNKFRNNCMKDSVLLTIACEGTSIFGGFAIFTILGHMAYTAGVPITDFAKSGPGLAFIVYPQAISYLPIPQLWGFLFFLMLFTLGLDSQFTYVETVLTTLADVWPRFVTRRRKTISVLYMVGMTLLSLNFAARNGIYLFTLVDWYVAAFTLLPQAALECVVVAWIYGSDMFCNDIELMIGKKVPTIFVYAWKYVTPTLIMILFFLTLVFYKPPRYEGYYYPLGAEIGGWLFAVVPSIAIIVVAIMEVRKLEGSLIQRLQKASRPSSEWGPALPEVREKYNNKAEMTPLSDADLYALKL